MSFILDSGQFQKTLDELATLTTRELPVFYNSRLLKIAMDARDHTPKAERETIEADLNVTGYRLNYTQKGDRLKKHSRGLAIFSGKRVYALVNARQKRLGEKPVPRFLMAAAASKFLGVRMSAVGTLRAGWNRAIQILGEAIKKSESATGPRVKMSSSAKPAKDGWNPIAELEYRENINRIGIRMIDPRVEDALSLAFDKEYAEMRRHLENKLNEIAHKSGAK